MRVINLMYLTNINQLPELIFSTLYLRIYSMMKLRPRNETTYRLHRKKIYIIKKANRNHNLFDHEWINIPLLPEI